MSSLEKLPSDAGDPRPGPLEPSPFAGIGLFTAQDPRLAFGPVAVDAVAVRPGLCSNEVAAELRGAGKRLFVWEALAGEANAPGILVQSFQAQGYIAQAETYAERDAARPWSLMKPPKALVGSDPYWLPGWTPLLECYGVAVPAELGAGFPVLGVFDDYRLADYLPSLGTRRDFWIYLAEGMTSEDWTTLAGLVASR